MKRIDSRWRPYGIMAVLSALITLFTLYYACGDGPLREALFASYFKSPLLLFMNFLPVSLCLSLRSEWPAVGGLFRDGAVVFCAFGGAAV